MFQRFEPVMVVEDNKIHIMWLLPQYTIVTIGEILFSITSMEFAYSQGKGLQLVLNYIFWRNNRHLYLKSSYN